MTTASPVLVATDLSEAARPALMLGRSHAAASNAPLVVCHVVSTVVRNHPLIPTPSENELMLEMNLISAAASSVTQEVDAVLHIPPDAYRVVIASGNADEEIVRTAEAHDASLIVVGAKPRVGAQRWLGHVAERVVRYAATSVLVARRDTPPRKALVVTDYSKGSLPALRFAQRFARRPDVDITLLHVFKPPSSALPSALMPLGDTWTPPSKTAMDELAALGRRTLEGLAKQYGFARFEQLEGEAADVILERAKALDVDTIFMGSRGRTGLARLVLGSVAEKVIRNADCSVLVCREPTTNDEATNNE